jgi:hypothetical protein
VNCPPFPQCSWRKSFSPSYFKTAAFYIKKEKPNGSRGEGGGDGEAGGGRLGGEERGWGRGGQEENCGVKYVYEKCVLEPGEYTVRGERAAPLYLSTSFIILYTLINHLNITKYNPPWYTLLAISYTARQWQEKSLEILKST